MNIKAKYKVLMVIAPLVFILDQLTKLAIIKYIPFGERISVIPGFFDIVHFRNTGAAFGMFSEMSDSFRIPFFYAIAVVAVIFLIIYYRSLKGDNLLMPVALSLVFGGIAGNVIDRIRLGSVVDFLSVHIGDETLKFSFLEKAYDISLEWPAFNVADSAITVSMFLFIFVAFFRKDCC
ncbi:MAG: signal peptidase II [Deltaproteobacteria bacterium]|jgi:signal peptidase II|nr:signal peptidase II [Deltaproteobacteria bacterium]